MIAEDAEIILKFLRSSGLSHFAAKHGTLATSSARFHGLHRAVPRV